MDSKDFVTLLVRDIKELSLLCEALPNMSVVPQTLLQLAKEKVENMSETIDSLMKNVEEGSNEVTDAIQKIDKAQIPSPVQNEDSEEKQDVILSTENTEGDNLTELEKPAILCDLEPEINLVEATKPKKTIEDSGTEECKDTIVETPVVEEKKVMVSPAKVDTVKDKERSSIKNVTITPSAESRFVKSLKLCLGDKFRYKKELFNDDMSLLNKTMAELDQLKTLDEAFAYIERFDWDVENPAVEDFVNLLQSRFL